MFWVIFQNVLHSCNVHSVLIEYSVRIIDESKNYFHRVAIVKRFGRAFSRSNTFIVLYTCYRL